MSTAPPPGPRPRPHRRALRQLLLGLVPVLVVGVALVVALAVRLTDVQAPLSAATGTATATVTAGGRAPDGRGLDVAFTDARGADRTGRIVLARAQDVPVGARLAVRYDPGSPAASRETVYADGDAAHARVGGAVFGLVAVVLVVGVIGLLTTLRITGRRRLHRRPAVTVTATHVVHRQGLLVRSWLELSTSAGLRWVPVHWAPELDRMPPGTPLAVHGDPARDRLVLPVVDGQELWPSGRVRDREPRGDVRQAAVEPDAPDASLGRQARADGVLPFLAPALGVLWAYVDGSGLRGFLVATVLAAAVLFWLPQLLGSDPRAPSRT